MRPANRNLKSDFITARIAVRVMMQSRIERKENFMKRIGKIAMAGLLLGATSFGAAEAKSIINGQKCYLVPNTGNYVTHGQIDCYTGQHVSVAGNAGNNIGTSPLDRRAAAMSAKDRRAEKHAKAWDGFIRNKHKAVESGVLALKALRDRDRAAFRQHTADAKLYGKRAAARYNLWNRTR